MGFQCKCSQVFCAAHRYADQHDCTYDFRAEARDKLTKANPHVEKPKLNQL